MFDRQIWEFVEHRMGVSRDATIWYGDRNDALLMQKAADFAVDGRLVDTHKDDLAFYGVEPEFRS